MNQYKSYIISFYIATLTLLILVKENDYRQGLDYNILNIHITSITITYILFSLLTSIYILNTTYKKVAKYIEVVNKTCIAASTSLIVSGSMWSWSQWGTLQFYDMKILITMIIVSLFITTAFILKIAPKLQNVLFMYNIYIVYHLPLLKYNVLWSSEIHQKNTMHLVDFFMVNYNGAFLIMLIIVHTTLIYTTWEVSIKKRVTQQQLDDLR
jgi:hypothetical protein